MATTYNNLYLDLRTALERVCAAKTKSREQLARDGPLYASPEV